MEDIPFLEALAEEERRFKNFRIHGTGNVIAFGDEDGYGFNTNPTGGGGEGACCNGEVCSSLSESDCADASGTFLGEGAPCDPNPCLTPTGACCAEDGSCSIETESDCNDAGGTYQGDDTACEDVDCTMGACCNEGDCTIETESDCNAAGGTYQGDGTTCDDVSCPLGCCRITITDVVISGTLTICDTPITFPDLPPMSCSHESDDEFCPSCDQNMSCSASRVIEDTGPYPICPGGDNLTGSVLAGASIACGGNDPHWGSIQTVISGSVDCPCTDGNPVTFTSVDQIDIDDPDDLPGTYPVSGDFSADGQPDLTWSGTMVIDRSDACKCPCRYMTVSASVDYVDCLGFSGTITLPDPGVFDWEDECCGKGGSVTANYSFTDPANHSFRLTFEISRPGNCNFIDDPWHIHTEGINALGICGTATDTDIPTPPTGTYDIVDDHGNTFHITISCSDDPPP